MRRGFTLIEILLVIGMLGILSSFSVAWYRRIQVRSDLNLAAEQISQGLARAKLLSQTAKNDDMWGFRPVSGTLFQGPSYALRTQEHDEQYPMPSTIRITGLPEVTFSKLLGKPSATGTILLTDLFGEQRSISITLNEEGIVTNEDDKLTICHKPHTASCNTMEVPEAAWPAHEGHGDHLGTCRSDECD